MLPQSIKDRLRIKRRIRHYKALMKNGVWTIDNRLLVLKGASQHDVNHVFEKFMKKRMPEPMRPRTILRKIIQELAFLNKTLVFGQEKFLSAEAVWMSRAGQLKFFDFGSRKLLTTSSQQERDAQLLEKKLNLHDYFKAPESTFVENQMGVFRQERLLTAPPLGLLSRTDQLVAVKRTLQTYKKYIEACRTPPQPDVVMQGYEEVRKRLPSDMQERFSRYDERIRDLSERYCFIEAHLDFNIANLLVDDDIWCVDLDDAGLSVPCLYDLNNLALNEVFEHRDLRILREMYSGELRSAFQDVVRSGIMESREGDLETTVVVNFLIRESKLVSDRLFKGVIPKQTVKHWALLEANIPWLHSQ